MPNWGDVLKAKAAELQAAPPPVQSPAPVPVVSRQPEPVPEQRTNAIAFQWPRARLATSDPVCREVLTAAERVELAGLLEWLRTAELPAVPFDLGPGRREWWGPAVMVTGGERFRAWLLANGEARGQVAVGVLGTIRQLREMGESL